MATQNFFALLGDDENEDPAAFIARVEASAPLAAAKDLKKKQQPPPPPPVSAKLPTKPPPPAQAGNDKKA